MRNITLFALITAVSVSFGNMAFSAPAKDKKPATQPATTSAPVVYRGSGTARRDDPGAVQPKPVQKPKPVNPSPNF